MYSGTKEDNGDGEWVPVIPVPGALTINTGDMMQVSAQCLSDVFINCVHCTCVCCSVHMSHILDMINIHFCFLGMEQRIVESSRAPRATHDGGTSSAL